MNLSLGQFQKQIERQSITWVQVLDMSGSLIAMFPEGKNEKAEVSEIKSQVETFAKDYGGRWRVHAKRNPTNKSDQMFKWTVDFNDVNVNSDNPVRQLQGAVSAKTEKDIEKRIRKELEAERKHLELAEEIKALKEHNKKMQVPMNKMAGVAEILLVNMAAKYFPGGQTAPLQGTANAEPDKLKKALELFSKHGVDENFLLELAKAVDKNPNLINTVKSFLGI